MPEQYGHRQDNWRVRNYGLPAVRALHLRRPALLAVAAGGLLGAPARYGLGRLLPTPMNGWPIGTFLANLVGAFVLGLLIEALARRGPDTGRRQQLRLFIGTGFCGALTTYSTLAAETALLARRGDVTLTVAYPLVSLLLGLLAAAAGIALAASQAAGPFRRQSHLPVDPDLPDETAEPEAPDGGVGGP